MDRYDLYEIAAQIPDLQARFLDAVHGCDPGVLCEDFCGSAAVARAWVRLDSNHTAVGIDLHGEVVRAAQARAEQRLDPEACSRLRLVEGDVQSATAQADVIAVLNFSICEIHDRRSLVGYLMRARERLRPRGVLVIDLYGGAEAWCPGSSTQEVEVGGSSVTYEWEQREVDVLRGRVINAMHFATDDGGVWRDAFVYDWRLWTSAELIDALREAGFQRIEAYSEYGIYMDEHGRLVPAPCESLDEDRFVAYYVARVGAAE